jgi:hypothetical protein
MAFNVGFDVGSPEEDLTIIIMTSQSFADLAQLSVAFPILQMKSEPV